VSFLLPAKIIVCISLLRLYPEKPEQAFTFGCKGNFFCIIV